MSFRFLAIAGTGNRLHQWCHDYNSLFMQAMRAEGGEPITLPDGSLYSWSGKLQGLLWYGENEWEMESYRVGDILERVPYEDRIVFAHSHGGQIIIKLTARGFKIRTLTTIATPYRPNLHPERSAENIGFWQHVYDPEKDWIASLRHKIQQHTGLGNIGGGGGLERRFIIPTAPNILNVGIPGVRHSGIFSPEHIHYFTDQGVFARAHQLGS